jgi:uncharacterized protein YdeI (YjbR/CyaY-like superfamily)
MLTRPRRTLPPFMKQALIARGLLAAYGARPPYQRNDYIGWITRAVRPETRAKRLAEMLDDLRRGDRYMGMAWRTPKRGTATKTKR